MLMLINLMDIHLLSRDAKGGGIALYLSNRLSGGIGSDATLKLTHIE